MTSEHGGESITSILTESRVFAPPSEFARQAHVSSLEQYEALWNRAKNDPDGFWGEMAGALDWSKRWDQVLDWKPPFARWFVGGTLNASANCIDRHCSGPNKNKAASSSRESRETAASSATRTSSARWRGSRTCSRVKA